MLSHYGPKFELHEIPDMSVTGAFGKAIQGVDGVLHIAMNTNMDPTDTSLIQETVQTNLQLLEAAARQPSVKSVVITSSQAACVWPVPGVPYEINVDSYNTWAIDESNQPWSGKGNVVERGLIIYAAAKARAEQEAWAWVKKAKPAYSFNTVVPNINWGTAVSPVNLGYRSSAAVLMSLVKGLSIAPMLLQVQWYVDVEDTALLHLAALELEDVNGDRILAMAGPYSYNGVLDILRRRYPEKKSKLQSVDEPKLDCGKVANERASELLTRMGKKQGFTSLEDTLVKAMDKFIECESMDIPKSSVDTLIEAFLGNSA